VGDESLRSSIAALNEAAESLLAYKLRVTESALVWLATWGPYNDVLTPKVRYQVENLLWWQLRLSPDLQAFAIACPPQ
jgi:hypothetical protein